MRQLSLVFGATAYAAATTLAIFFLGLAIGSALWGERAARIRRPLRVYAWLELAIAISALGFLALAGVARSIDVSLLAAAAAIPALGVVAPLFVATVLLLPPAVFMGGTLPMLAEHGIRDRAQLGRTGALLYAINTAGGAAGALAAGFYLPAALGVRGAYLLAVAMSLTVAVIAAGLSRRERPRAPTTDPGASDDMGAVDADRAPAPPILPIAFLSGFAALGLEVLWTRMFAQVLHNSVYSFAVILGTFLIALAVGAAVARRLCRLATPPERVLVLVLALAGIAVALTPWWFQHLTDGLTYVAPRAGWAAYVAAVFGHAALALFVPGVLVGTIFPYLLRIAPPNGYSPGRTLGRLAAVNTAGAIVGSLAAGFVLLPALGLWGGLNALALLYLATALWIVPTGAPRWLRAAPLIALLGFATILTPSRLPIVRIDPTAGEILYEAWESAYGVTAVVRSKDSLRIKLDNYYSLGGTAAAAYEQTQADIPLVLHPEPKSVFFLGLGTGITAGAAMLHDVERVVVAELVPDVITASRKYFGPHLHGLFDDPRTRVVAADGRNLLRASDDRYDVVIADLFIPWQAGTGSLYTREHFETVRDRLAPGGLFAQWLPLYQLSREETFIIARTMLDVFPHVTVWRGDFLPKRPIVALIAAAEPTALDPDAVVANYRHRRQSPDLSRATALALMALFYGGNLGASPEPYDAYAVNTDERPIIEYSAPLTQRSQTDATARWFRGAELARWYQELAQRVPLDADPYLARLEAGERAYAGAGTSLFASKVALEAGDEAAAQRHAAAFLRSVPPEVARTFGTPLSDAP